jgi:hypothetical protein
MVPRALVAALASLSLVVALVPGARARRRPRSKKPLFSNVNSPQQLYMYQVSRAEVLMSRGRHAAALRALRLAQKHRNTTALQCSFGDVHFRLALAALRSKGPGDARAHLLKARVSYRHCAARIRSPRLGRRARAGLRDIERLLPTTAGSGTDHAVPALPSPPREGVKATIATGRCDAAALARKKPPPPIAHATSDGSHVQLELRRYRLGSCARGVEVRVERSRGLIDFVTYRDEAGTCLSLCDLTLRAPLALPPGEYEVRVRSRGHPWIMQQVPSQRLRVPAPAR